jgi:ligand-binding sensor domain-containing protein
MRLLTLLIFLVSTSSLILAQRFSFIEYNTNKGLPQSQVNTIAQDNVGYLWIGTYGGLARFDGENFKNFGRNKGLLNNRVTKLAVINGVLYIGHPQGISIKNNDNTFVSIPYSNTSLLEDVSGFATIDSTVYVSTNGGGLFAIENKKLIPIKNSPPRIRDLIRYKDNIYLATRTGLFLFDGNKFRLIDKSNEISFSGMSNDDQQLLATSFNGKLYQIDTDLEKIKPILSNDYLLFRNVTVDHQKYKWINSRDGILLIKAADTLRITEDSGLPTNDIDVVFEDSENNIWIGTNGKGLIRFTDEVFTYYNEDSGFPSDLIIAMEIDAYDNKWISTIDQGVFKMDPSGEITKIDFIPSAVWQIVCADDVVLFASNFGLFTYDHSQFKSFYKEEDNLPSNRIKGIHSLDDSTFLISTTEGGILFDKKSKQLKEGKEIFKKIKNVRDFASKGETLYAAATNGIYTIKEGRITQEHFDSGINCIELDNKGRLWVGTENGLFVYNQGKYKRIFLEKENSLEFVNFLQKYDTLMFIGTNNGLYEIGSNQQHKYHYGITSGLIDLETNLNSNFLEDNRYLWFGTASGLMKMDLHLRASLMKTTLPRVQLTDIIVNNKELDQTQVNTFNSKNNNTLTIKYADKNVSFKFDGIYMTNPESLRYSYFLEGFSNEWTRPTKSPNASFTNLPPGKYIFKFKVNNGVDKTSKIFTVPIEVLPPFYLTWWFYLIVGILIILIVLTIDRARTKRLETKNYQIKLEFQNKLSKLEQQSLNASMNRHFIFNSLNSIQYYINTSDTRSANKYLSRFAKLIRKNLDSSYHEDGMVALSDEIERLKLYLDLESMRFIDRFDYSIDIEDSVETDLLKVPAMFLQPFVENSIIHGVLPLKDKKGKIDIIISDHMDHIRIEIKDNGVGIEDSQTNKKEDLNGHRSQGMLIARGRIELLQKISERSIEMIGPHQIKESNSSLKGTVVIFKIMKQYLG